MVMLWLINLNNKLSLCADWISEKPTTAQIPCESTLWDCAALSHKPLKYGVFFPVNSILMILVPWLCLVSPCSSASHAFSFLLSKHITSSVLSMTAIFHTQYEVMALRLAECWVLHCHISHLRLCAWVSGIHLTQIYTICCVASRTAQRNMFLSLNLSKQFWLFVYTELPKIFIYLFIYYPQAQNTKWAQNLTKG